MEIKSNKAFKGYIFLGALIGFGLFLLALPGSYFDEGPPMCLSVILLNRECYGCGMTRGVMHLIHFEFAEAWAFNKLAFVVFPLMVYMILWEIWRRFFKKN